MRFDKKIRSMYNSHSDLAIFILTSALLVCGVHAEFMASRTFSRYNSLSTVDQTTISTTRARLYNDIPDPRSILISKTPTGLIKSIYRKTKSQSTINGGYEYLTTSAISTFDNKKVNDILPPDMEKHPGEEIIRYIHDQDGEKDREIL